MVHAATRSIDHDARQDEHISVRHRLDPSVQREVCLPLFHQPLVLEEDVSDFDLVHRRVHTLLKEFSHISRRTRSPRLVAAALRLLALDSQLGKQLYVAAQRVHSEAAHFRPPRDRDLPVSRHLLDRAWDPVAALVHAVGIQKHPPQSMRERIQNLLVLCYLIVRCDQLQKLLEPVLPRDLLLPCKQRVVQLLQFGPTDPLMDAELLLLLLELQLLLLADLHDPVRVAHTRHVQIEDVERDKDNEEEEEDPSDSGVACVLSPPHQL
mmetsp:Transcript_15510/g.51994  ORF Transcript_15510/g.51994 Transcript_15510/m.51994 type:complete len:266 (+) Transcript_15510:3706-4503(+)